MKGKFLGVLFVSVVVGSGWAVYDAVERGDLTAAHLPGPAEPPPAPLPTPPAPTKSTTSPTVPAPVVPPVVAPPPSLPTIPATEVAGVLAEADKQARSAKFKLGADRLARFQKERLSPADADRVERRRKALASYQQFCDGVDPATMLGLEDNVVVHLTNGNRLEGKMTSDSPSDVWIRRANGIEGAIPRGQIKSIEKVPPSEIRTRVEADLKKQEERLRRPTGLDLFELGVFCYRNGLAERVVDYFDRAVAADPALPETIAEAKARELYETALWFRQRGSADKAQELLDRLKTAFPQSRYAALAGGPRPGPVAGGAGGSGGSGGGAGTVGGGAGGTGGGTGGLPPVAGDGDGAVVDATHDDLPVEPPASNDSTPVFRNPETAKVVQAANDKYKEGLEQLERSYGKDAGANVACRKALDAFREAVKLYDEAMTLEPGNAWIERRHHAASEQRVHCFLRAK
ncbi:MAG: hypothetical protein HYY93_07125 [Planctomycetes bacterium]|nr:hypothetical protein [Planctomycetota bacterium]